MQWTLLHQKGRKNPDLIQHCYNDLEETLINWENSGYEIILMIDANELIGCSPGGLTLLLGKVGISDLLTAKTST
jgi:hypothetical protein